MSAFHRLVVIGDLHSGHVLGMTAPGYIVKSPEETEQRRRGRTVQEATRKWFTKTIDALQPIDTLLVNGDCIDGKGQKSGGTELIITDRKEQCDMAKWFLMHAKAKQIVMTFGTPYHVGMNEDWERTIADDLGATIDNFLWLDINGTFIHARHFASRSIIPYGRHTPIAREHTWNLVQMMEAEHQEIPKADIILRSHVHYFDYCGNANYLGMTLPSLQAAGSKFGARIMTGRVDVGMVHFDIYGPGKYTWNWHLAKLVCEKVDVLKL